VRPMARAAEVGDVFVTVTGNMAVIRQEHFVKMKDGAIVANSGHFNVEIDLEALAKLAQSRRTVRPFVEEFVLRGGRRIYVLGEGRLINLAAAEGHPAAVMDMSFANQALSAEFMAKKSRTLARRVYVVPREIDLEIARLKLVSMGVEIDDLTPQQESYLASWRHGTSRRPSGAADALTPAPGVPRGRAGGPGGAAAARAALHGLAVVSGGRLQPGLSDHAVAAWQPLRRRRPRRRAVLVGKPDAGRSHGRPRRALGAGRPARAAGAGGDRAADPPLPADRHAADPDP